MALTPLPSSIGRGSNPQLSEREQGTLPLDHSFIAYSTKVGFAYLDFYVYLLVNDIEKLLMKLLMKLTQGC